MTSDKSVSTSMPDRSRDDADSNTQTTNEEVQDHGRNTGEPAPQADRGTSVVVGGGHTYIDQKCSENAYQHNGNVYMSVAPAEGHDRGYYRGQFASGNATQINGNVYGKAKEKDHGGEEARK